MSWLILILVLLTVGMIIYSLYYYAIMSPLLITADEARSRIANGQIDVVLDVRSNMEYNLGHYAGAVHVPVGHIEARIREVLPNRAARILVYCNTGQRSRYAAELMKKLGYRDVSYIATPYWSLLA